MYMEMANNNGGGLGIGLPGGIRGTPLHTSHAVAVVIATLLAVLRLGFQTRSQPCCRRRRRRQ
jgi:hypothetical protein